MSYNQFLLMYKESLKLKALMFLEFALLALFHQSGFIFFTKTFYIILQSMFDIHLRKLFCKYFIIYFTYLFKNRWL